MVEEDRVDHPDEQYQFSDELNTTQQFELEGEQEPSKPSFFQSVLQFLARNRPLAFLLFIVFAVSIVYQFVRTPSVPKPKAATPAAVATTHTTGTFDSQQSAVMKSQISELQKNLSDQMNATKQLSQTNQSGLAALKAELTQANQSMAQLRADNAQLKTSLHQQSAQITAINRSLHPQAKVEPLRYYIQAIVPGRAWLSSNKGDYMTVQLGTNLPQYGAIRQINSDAGLIVTSSGKIIHFSANE